MSTYKPTTESIRDCYVFSREHPDGTFIASQREHEAEFDRWLAGVKADAIRETATLTTRRGQGFVYVADILEYARRVAKGGA